MRTSVLAALMLSTTPAADPLEAKIQEVLNAPDLIHARLAFRSLFEAAGDSGLARLKTHANDSIAIQAAWREVLLTVPEKKGNEVYRPAQHRLNWFIGFLEGRARLKLPAWWQEAVLDAEAHRRGNVYFRSRLPLQQTGIQYVFAPVGTNLEKVNGKIVLSVGKESLAIPDSVLRSWGDVSALMTPERCYVAAHEGVGYHYDLACIDRKSQKPVWKSRVWATWSGGASGPRRYSSVTVTEQDGRIVVFGISGSGAYVEGFKGEDGRNLFRFSTYHR
jgi:hypothetical protein